MTNKTALAVLAEEIQQAANFPAYPAARYEEAAEALKKLDSMSEKIAYYCHHEGLPYSPDDVLGSLERLLTILDISLGI